MKLPIFILLLALLLSACASSPQYALASSKGLGFSEHQIAEAHYLVSFKSKGANKKKNRALAQRRAAELAQAQGYDWFVIINTQVEIEHNEQALIQRQAPPQIVRECNLLSCRTHTLASPSIGTSSIDNRDKLIETLLEIRLGRGVKSMQEYIFDAQN
jgi:hypothetical protein